MLEEKVFVHKIKFIINFIAQKRLEILPEYRKDILLNTEKNNYYINKKNNLKKIII